MIINVFAIIIFVALILGFALELFGNLLNLKALKLELPTALDFFAALISVVIYWILSESQTTVPSEA